MTYYWWQIEEEAIRALVAAHRTEFGELLSQAERDAAIAPPCEQCAFLDIEPHALADLLGHQAMGHRVLRGLLGGGIHSVADLERAAADGMEWLRLPGIGTGGLEHIQHVLRRVAVER